MIMHFPFAMLAAAAGAEHGEEQSLSEVLMHHISNHDYPSLAQWGMSKGVVMMLTAAVILIVVTGWFFRKSRVSNGAPKGVTNALEVLVLFVRDEIAIAHVPVRLEFGDRHTDAVATFAGEARTARVRIEGVSGRPSGVTLDAAGDWLLTTVSEGN